MIEDDIIEISDSPFINPLTVVYKEDKKLRVCVDAKNNQFTIPDSESTPPIQELLQRFNGARFMTSIDLSTAFLHIKLNEASRKYTYSLSIRLYSIPVQAYSVRLSEFLISLLSQL
jgi:hypothetical protein